MTIPHDHLTTPAQFDTARFAIVVIAVDAKATAIGAGTRLGDIVAVPGVDGAYVGHYAAFDIFVGADGIAHEVHGAIREKYGLLGGPTGLLGLPVTDETACPDGSGRFNHFTGGSVYWTPRTGAMSVHGRVRDRWAASGWERGPLGYPVRDQHRMVTTTPAPGIEWCVFENGVIASDPVSAHPAPVALQTPEESHGVTAQPALLTYVQLGALFGARINTQFKASPDNVALRAGVELTGVTDWTPGQWAASPRTVGFRLHGFHDNGLAPDTDFRIDLSVALELVWTAGFTEPVTKTLVARLTFLRVTYEGGLELGPVIDGVRSGISNSFQATDPARPEIPAGSVFIADVPTGTDTTTGAIDVLDVLVTAAGDLQVLVNPLGPPGHGEPEEFCWAALRQLGVQNVLDTLADS